MIISYATYVEFNFFFVCFCFLFEIKYEILYLHSHNCYIKSTHRKKKLKLQRRIQHFSTCIRFSYKCLCFTFSNSLHIFIGIHVCIHYIIIIFQYIHIINVNSLIGYVTIFDGLFSYRHYIYLIIFVVVVGCLLWLQF